MTTSIGSSSVALDDLHALPGSIDLPADFPVVQTSVSRDVSTWIEDPSAEERLLALEREARDPANASRVADLRRQVEEISRSNLTEVPSITRYFDAAIGLAPTGLPNFTETLAITVTSFGQYSVDRLFPDGRVPRDGVRVTLSRGREALVFTEQPIAACWQESEDVAVTVSYQGDGGVDRLLEFVDRLHFS